MTNLSNLDPAVSSDTTSGNRQLLDPQRPDENVLPLSLSALDGASGKKQVALNARNNKLPLEAMIDVPITLVFEVGRTDITIKQLMELCEGSYIGLRHISVDSIDVRVNEIIIAEAETIALQQRYGIRFGEVAMITSSEIKDERLQE
jgi:flagellar motor switch protein FliN/FliY